LDLFAFVRCLSRCRLGESGSIRGAFSQESDRVRKNPREEPVAHYMLWS
jgi:hypothetical protein